MQISGANGFRKGLAQPVEKIEDERLFDLNFLFRALELADANALPPPSEEPSRERRDEQPEEKNWPQAPRAESVRRRLVIEVLL